MAEGDKYCICGAYLGNYLNGTGNSFSIRAMKYCDACRPIVANRQKNFSFHNRKKSFKQVNAELLAQNALLKKQNALLREENSILKGELEELYDDA